MAMRGFRDLEVATDKMMTNLSSMSQLSESNFAAFAQIAADSIVGMAKKMLLQNLERSGVGTITPGNRYQHQGNIKNAVARADVGVKVAGKKITIYASMPAGMKPYLNEDTGSKSDFYTVAASLNFGAVRTAKERRKVVDLPTGKSRYEVRSVIGEKAKRTVKKYALGQAVSSRAINSVEEGRRFETASNKKKGKVGKSKTIKGFHVGTITENKKSVSLSGGAVVIKPRPFFEFTSSQKQAISKAFMSKFIELYKKAFGL